MEHLQVILIIAAYLLLLGVTVYFTTKQENYQIFWSRTSPPNYARRLKGYGDDGAICIGSRFNADGKQLTLSTRECDSFRGNMGSLANNELISDYTGNSVSAYYNANANGQPLEYTTKWRGQKFAFDGKGQDADTGAFYGTIRHIDSGKCLHPEGGTANRDGQRVVVWGDCSPVDRIMWNVYPRM